MTPAIDTTALTVAQLRELLRALVAAGEAQP
jgi:hypothetical protein